MEMYSSFGWAACINRLGVDIVLLLSRYLDAVELTDDKAKP